MKEVFRFVLRTLKLFKTKQYWKKAWAEEIGLAFSLLKEFLEVLFGMLLEAFSLVVFAAILLTAPISIPLIALWRKLLKK